MVIVYVFSIYNKAPVLYLSSVIYIMACINIVVV